MSGAEQLIAALTRRIRAFELGERGAVLDRMALVEVDALFEHVTDAEDGVPFDAVRVVAWLYWYRYQAQPDENSDLEAALRLFSPMADVDPRTVPVVVRQYLASVADRSSDLEQRARTAVDQLQRAMNSDDIEALNQSIALLADTVTVSPADSDGRAALLSMLGVALRVRFERTGAEADIDRAVRVGREAAAATSSGHTDRRGYPSNLGGTLQTRFGHSADLADLDEATRVSQEATATIPDEHPDRAAMLTNLGLALRTRFARIGDVVDLDEAIRVGQRAMAAMPDDQPDRPAMLLNLGGSLDMRFECTGAIVDLDEAIRLCREAVAAMPGIHPDRGTHLSSLGTALQRRFARTGADADLDEAIRVGRQAVAATSAGRPRRAAHLSNLAIALRSRFTRTGADADLDEAIRVGREALAVTPDDHPPGEPPAPLRPPPEPAPMDLDVRLPAYVLRCRARTTSAGQCRLPRCTQRRSSSLIASQARTSA
ncbi:hypothetical protein GCM10022251_77600 [Phytohabitans flavus]|uniref:Tetratricopeptide repeat protein n=1 Tax=Phytohabitans flavus TaxID=1076124 RepID=A0A6F8XIM7_9ACTN|nr:tetratricopeptide repeat protein [Phytohabitans flavus]BCB73648.1 hypothetical protein Pflav_000580 [Phytohabitans flavus]